MDRNRYGYYSVKNVSFKVKEGEHFALLGSNDSGTSAVLMAILGQIKPVRGSVSVCGVQ